MDTINAPTSPKKKQPQSYVIISDHPGRTFTAAEAAELLDTSVKSIRKAISAGYTVRGNMLASIHDRLPPGWMSKQRDWERSRLCRTFSMDRQINDFSTLHHTVADRHGVDPERAAAAVELVDDLLSRLGRRDAQELREVLASGGDQIPPDLLRRCRAVAGMSNAAELFVQ